MPTADAVIGGEFGRVMGWADQFRRLKVRTNADTPHDAAQARKFGAQGIGLCRTEHMFFDEDRIPAIRRDDLLRHCGSSAKPLWPSSGAHAAERL